MKHTLISITKCSYTDGYEIAVKPGFGNKTKTRSGYRAGQSPEEAAAQAMSEAIAAGGAFMIFAPPEVLKHIPKDYRKSEELT